MLGAGWITVTSLRATSRSSLPARQDIAPGAVTLTPRTQVSVILLTSSPRTTAGRTLSSRRTVTRFLSQSSPENPDSTRRAPRRHMMPAPSETRYAVPLGTAGVAETYARELRLSKGIQMDAAEMVYGAREYALGKAIRKGQEEGTVLRRGQMHSKIIGQETVDTRNMGKLSPQGLRP